MTHNKILLISQWTSYTCKYYFVFKVLLNLREAVFENRIFIRIGPCSYYILIVNEKRPFEINFFSVESSPAAGKPGLLSKNSKFLTSSNLSKHCR